MRMPSMKRREQIWGLTFITPIVLQFLLFAVVPLGVAIWAAFTNWNLISGSHDFVGLANFAKFLADHGRYGIPFNIVYGPGAPDGIALPELLSDGAVLDALNRAAGGEPGKGA